MLQTMITHVQHQRGPFSIENEPCVICGSKSIGMNFCAMTCAPCKAFFRRNARKKELLQIRCQHRDLSALFSNNDEGGVGKERYSQIRRCTACRLRRCFEMGMREELIRTDEENQQYRQLVAINRKRRNLSNVQISTNGVLPDPHVAVNIGASFEKIDWTHLSNIVFAYDSLCLKIFADQRSAIVFNCNSPLTDEQLTHKHPTGLTFSIVLGVSTFLKSLPAFNSLPRFLRNYLCKTNIRPLIFPNVHELNQSCYSEPWQAVECKSTWEYICGSELYKQFVQAEKLAQELWVNDPVVTRLWVIILFFSTPLHYHSDGPTLTPIVKRKKVLLQTQNVYITLLWKYLISRYSSMEPSRMLMNLVHVYMKMQTVGFGMYLKLKSEQQLKLTNESLSKLVLTNGSEGE